MDMKTPVRDFQFVLNEVLDMPATWASLPGCEEATPDTVNAIIEAMAQFADNELVPLYQQGDEGCTYHDGEVSTPAGFKEAYQKYVEAGWPSLSSPVEYGGQGLPESLGMVAVEMLATANVAWSMYPALSHGAKQTLMAHGSEEQKQTYLTRLIDGSWCGTMCLTEAHCGSDLGLLRTKAEPNEDGSYRITGSKIFISSGEHDLAENIVHLVLARLPDSPAGTKGISIFVVPKFLPKEDGSVGERNALSCGAIEHKMGIHGNATCVLNFDGATGFLIGEVNKGLNHMFVMMNAARLATGIQGVGALERSYQPAAHYAQERLQMRSLSGPKNPEGPADPIIVHPDVRRLLLTTRTLGEGCRMLAHYGSQKLDIAERSDNAEERHSAEQILAVLTPIVKAFCTEVGFEGANHALQCFGGHGYIKEWGMEQVVRDTRIAMLYEGTTGIQAIDLLGRKVLGSGGELLKPLAAEIQGFVEANLADPAMAEFAKPLAARAQQLAQLTQDIAARAAQNPEEVGAASVDYLMYAGYVCLGYLWARAAKVAQQALQAGSAEKDFYQAKVHKARFYFERILPRTETLAQVMESGADNLMALEARHFLL